MPQQHRKQAAGKKQGRTQQPRFLCKRCDRQIRIPEGWSFGPAVRKHYWAKHPEIMQARRARSGAGGSR